jgi:hypothetical protein
MQETSFDMILLFWQESNRRKSFCGAKTFASISVWDSQDNDY